MKTLIYVMVLLVFYACNTKKSPESVETPRTERDTVMTETPAVEAQLFACPMHPEVTGKKGDKCPKCGMALTEPLQN